MTRSRLVCGTTQGQCVLREVGLQVDLHGRCLVVRGKAARKRSAKVHGFTTPDLLEIS
jgi:hypothetical protein